MKEVAKALQAFYSGFGLRAFPEDSVPEKEEDGSELLPPYITYTVVQPRWDEFAVHQARVWTRSTSFVEAANRAEAIIDAIGEGITIPVEGGYITLDPGTPLVQMQPIDDPLYKVAYINLQLGAFIAQKG